MRLLVVSQYFWPETFIISDLVRTLKNQGHTVVVATGKPNYPDGQLFDGYRAGGTQYEKFDSTIDVFRVPLRPRGAGGSINLVLNYLSFAISGATRFPGLLAHFEPEAIVVFAPSPITAAIAAIPLKWIKRAHLAIWVQDLWPESLAATGHMRNRAALSAVGVIVRAIYACADTLLVQTRAFIAPVARLAASDKIVYYPNSISLATKAGDSEDPLPLELADALATHFCVVFAGNVGTVQAVQTVVEAASLLTDLLDVRLVIIGSGSMSAWVAEQKRARALNNLLIVGRLPMSTMPAVYRRAGALLVTLKTDEALSRTIPSKLQAYLAAGRPIVAGLNGEGARLVEEARAGLTCAGEDPEALAQIVRAIHGMPTAERDAMGRAGKSYFMKHFEMDRQAERLVEILESRMSGKSRGA